MKVATLKDVAKEAHVSLATASYALNDDERIKEATRKKVKEVAKRLKYVPNGSARLLRQKQSHRIIIFVSSFGGPIYQEILEYIYQKLQINNYEMLVCNGKSAQSILSEKNYDGIINFDATIKTSILKEASEYNFPIIDTTRNWENSKIISLPLRGKKPVYEIINMAIKEGYKSFAYVHGSLDSYDDLHRYGGFKKALDEANLLPSAIMYGNFTNTGGYDAIKAYLKGHKELPEVIFFANDEMAIGAMDYLKKVNYDLKMVKIIGFDNIQLGKFYNPSLTTIEIDRNNWTTQIVNILLQSLNSLAKEEYICKYKIIRRETF